MFQKNLSKNVDLQFVCTANWDDMMVCEGGRFCNGCQKIVYDFSHKTEAAYERALAQHGGNLCGKFSRAQVHKHTLQVAAGLLVALALNGSASSAIPAPTLPKNAMCDTLPDVPFLGLCILPMPRFKDGEAAMFQFLRDNVQYPSQDSTYSGTVYLQFMVEGNGHLSDIKVKRGFHPLFDAEAMRVVQLMDGKWVGGKDINGQPTRIRITLPIRFKLEVVKQN